MKNTIALLYALMLGTFTFDRYMGGSLWHAAPLLVVWFLLTVLHWLDAEQEIERYSAGRIRQAEAQCRTEELL